MFALELLHLHCYTAQTCLHCLFIYIAHTLTILYPTSITNIINNVFENLKAKKEPLFQLSIKCIRDHFYNTQKNHHNLNFRINKHFLSLLTNVFFKAFVPTFSNFLTFCSVCLSFRNMCVTAIMLEIYEFKLDV